MSVFGKQLASCAFERGHYAACFKFRLSEMAKRGADCRYTLRAALSAPNQMSDF